MDRWLRRIFSGACEASRVSEIVWLDCAESRGASRTSKIARVSANRETFCGITFSSVFGEVQMVALRVVLQVRRANGTLRFSRESNRERILLQESLRRSNKKRRNFG